MQSLYYQSNPLVEIAAPALCFVSISQAFLRARATALKLASMM
jgi:hypothetical protein